MTALLSATFAPFVLVVAPVAAVTEIYLRDCTSYPARTAASIRLRAAHIKLDCLRAGPYVLM